MTGRRLLALTAAAALAAGTASYPAPGYAAPGPAAAGYAAQAGLAGYCPDGNGVTVVVDFQELGGDIIIRCAPGDQPTGHAALINAGISIEGTVRWGEAFICRIEGKPGPQDEPCIDTPPATAYWSYWHAPDGGSWSYSQLGAMYREPPPGSFEGWSFSLNNTAGTNPPPRVAPVRPAPPAATQPAPGSGNGSGQRDPAPAPPAETNPDRGGHPQTGDPQTGETGGGPRASGPDPDPAPATRASPSATHTPPPATPWPATHDRSGAAGVPSELDLAARDRSGTGGPPASTLVGIGLVASLGVAGGLVALRRRGETGG